MATRQSPGTLQKESLADMIKSDVVDKVSAGEVCSISVAKQLGIFNPDTYYTPTFRTLKTMNDHVDSIQNRNQFALCAANAATKTATPSCYLLPTAGVGFTTKQGFDKCIAAECPPGFTEDPINPRLCKKPLRVKTVLLNTRNDERWYDWYSIPNYHLGNKYATSSNIHYKPCGPYEVPNFAKDPADGETKDWSSVDKIDECISKSIYFGGKYENTSDYCPMATIKRIGSAKEELENDYADLLNKEFLNDSEKQHIQRLYNEFKNTYTAETRAPTQQMADACETVESPERLQQAYRVCEQLIKNEPSFMNKFKEESETELNMRKYVTKFNCHQLFCPSVNDRDPARKIGKGGICFDSLGTDTSKVNEAVNAHYKEVATMSAAKQQAAEDDAAISLGTASGTSRSCALQNVCGPVSCSTNPTAEGEPISCEKQKDTFIKHATKTNMIIIIVTIIIAVIIVIWIILQPLFMRLWNWIKCRLKGFRRFSGLHCATASELNAIIDARERIREISR